MPLSRCERCGDLGAKSVGIWIDRKFSMPRGRNDEYDEEFMLCEIHVEAAMESILTDQRFIRDLMQRRTKNVRF